MSNKINLHFEMFIQIIELVKGNINRIFRAR